MSGLDVVRVETTGHLEQALAIRRTVFVHEQGVSEAAEIDGLDDGAWHLLALERGRPVGTLRIRLLDQGRVAKIERVAVLEMARGRRVGHALMHEALDLAKALGAGQVKLHAQTTAQDFYAKLGFRSFGEVFDEDGLPHIAMRLSFEPPPLRAAG